MLVLSRLQNYHYPVCFLKSRIFLALITSASSLFQASMLHLHVCMQANTQMFEWSQKIEIEFNAKKCAVMEMGKSR